MEARGPARVARRLAAILAADVAGSSRLDWKSYSVCSCIVLGRSDSGGHPRAARPDNQRGCSTSTPPRNGRFRSRQRECRTFRCRRFRPAAARGLLPLSF
jgi:hypothetical protein